jgi:hypothetical protein
MRDHRPNAVRQEDIPDSYTLVGTHPSQRTRVFDDGRPSRQEWQCEECHIWYTSLEWRIVNLKATGGGADWCRYCRPPKAGGAIDHLWTGGAVLLGWNQQNDFTRAMKRALERRATQTQNSAASDGTVGQ